MPEKADHLFQYLLSIYSMPVTVLGPGSLCLFPLEC